MSNINLLPEERRDDEKKELEKLSKKSKIFDMDMTAGEKIIPEKEEKNNKGFGWWPEKKESPINAPDAAKKIVNEPVINAKEIIKEINHITEKKEKNAAGDNPKKTEKQESKHKSKEKNFGFNIDLMPEELSLSGNANRNVQTLIIVISFLVVIAIGLVSFYGIISYQKYLRNQIAKSQKNLDNVKNEISQALAEQNANVYLDHKIIALSSLAKNHIYWSNFFDFLEKNTLDGVYYSNFSAATGNNLILPAIARDYDTAVNQIIALRNAKDFVKEVRVDSLETQSDNKKGYIGIAFNIKLLLNDGIFIKK